MRTRVLGSVGLLATTLLLLIGAAPAAAATGPYVSLGDSYTAAPLVPSPTGNPILCGRSTNNYPSDVARAISPLSFTDVSCSSATTVDMTQAQNLYGVQSNPPQFNALGTADALVTIGIGGNDAGLISVAEECAKLDATTPTGTPCKNHYTASGSDPNVAAINATGPKVANVIQGVHTRAPSAKVLIVGYPDGLPTNGTACWPFVPVTAGDIKYFNGLEQQLNRVEASEAAANNATFVDTWNSSIGHDACKPPGVAWVNGIVPTSAAFPLHPNQLGEANMARQVIAALG
ncbi:MAG TPA: SGNH/GDSL hydrolase family protein [Solirubrobacteraceae bacterium]|nr:SGNH/GDSL hydrolase family protein [Solirubrobacteraceae bacterium]